MTRTPVPLPALLAVPPDRLHDLGDASRLEWYEPDGRGGYAAATAVGANTRNSHGVVVAADEETRQRHVLLSRLDETASLADGSRYELGVAFYPEAVHPTGHVLLQGFALDPWPTWRYRLGDVELVKELFVSRRVRATVIRYRARGGSVTLELRPLVPVRINGDPSRVTDGIRTDAEASEGIVGYRPHDEVPPLVLSFGRGAWHAAPDWYYNVGYPLDEEEGRTAREDLFCPGVLVLALEESASITVTCGRRPARIANAAHWVAEELRRRGGAADAGRLAAHDDERLAELGARLGLAADGFLIDSPDGPAIVAGYPDAAPAPREASALVPGLLLTTGRLADAAAVLRTTAARIAAVASPPVPVESGAAAGAPAGGIDFAGLMPRAGEEPGGASGVEALWFIEAVARLRTAGGDVSVLTPVALDALDAVEGGRWPGLRLRADGLVEALDPDGNGATATVAACALWYNALVRAAELTSDHRQAARYAALAERCGAAFDAFWFPGGGYLHDRLGPDGRGLRGLRPAQLLALSLADSPLAGARARKVVDTVDRELLVAAGVRTLSAVDAGYDGRSPDRGAALPAWLDHFAAAYARVYGADRHTRERLRRIIAEFDAHLAQHALGHVSERFAGEPPHTPAGVPACALSCAALLEVLHIITRPAQPRVAEDSAVG